MENSKTNIITNATEKRKQIKGLIDDFATFWWRGENAWDKFGVFIINEGKGDLKFYNGPSFSNEYSTPMFSSSSGNLMGVNFKIQPIKFKIGMYWFTIDEYQKFVDWINPYEINYLSFGFESNYGYLVKLASISDSPRYVIGHDGGSPVYYTEMELSWEVQGNSCVRSNLPYEWNSTPENNGSKRTVTWRLNMDGMTEKSLLDTPIVLEVPVSIPNSNSLGNGQITFKVSLDGKEWTNLFNISFENLISGTEGSQEPVNNLESGETYYLYEPTNKNYISFNHSIKTDHGDKPMVAINFGPVLGKDVWYSYDETSFYPISSFPLEFTAIDTTIPDSLKGHIYSIEQETVQGGFEDSSRPSKFTIKYDSETGIIFIQVGSESTWKILSYLTDTVSGDYLVESIDVHKYLLPGSFTNDNYNMSDVYFRLELEDLEAHDENTLTIYSRKNVI